MSLLLFTVVCVLLMDFLSWIRIDEGIYLLQLAIFSLTVLSVCITLVFILPELFEPFYKKQADAKGHFLLLLVLVISLSAAKMSVYTLQYNLPYSSGKSLVFVTLDLLVVLLALVVVSRIDLTRTSTLGGVPINTPKTAQEYLNIKGDLLSEHLTLPTDELLYIKSSENYSEFYVATSTGIKQTVLRLTLKSVEQQIPYNYIVRTHKSFIVNLMHVEKISGNANNAKVHFRAHDLRLPVSRSKRDGVISVLDTLIK